MQVQPSALKKVIRDRCPMTPMGAFNPWASHWPEGLLVAHRASSDPGSMETTRLRGLDRFEAICQAMRFIQKTWQELGTQLPSAPFEFMRVALGSKPAAWVGLCESPHFASSSVPEMIIGGERSREHALETYFAKLLTPEAVDVLDAAGLGIMIKRSVVFSPDNPRRFHTDPETRMNLCNSGLFIYNKAQAVLALGAMGVPVASSSIHEVLASLDLDHPNIHLLLGFEKNIISSAIHSNAAVGFGYAKSVDADTTNLVPLGISFCYAIYNNGDWELYAHLRALTIECAAITEILGIDDFSLAPLGVAFDITNKRDGSHGFFPVIHERITRSVIYPDGKPIRVWSFDGPPKLEIFSFIRQALAEPTITLPLE